MVFGLSEAGIYRLLDILFLLILSAQHLVRGTSNLLTLIARCKFKADRYRFKADVAGST